MEDDFVIPSEDDEDTYESAMRKLHELQQQHDTELSEHIRWSSCSCLTWQKRLNCWNKLKQLFGEKERRSSLRARY